MRLTGRAKARHCLALFLASFLAPPIALRCQQRPLGNEVLRVLQGSPLEGQYSEMLFDYLAGMAAKEEEVGLARLRAIRSEADFREWRADHRRKFLQLIGGLPDERAPLNAHVLGEFKRADYLVRKVVFESLPEYYVTSNLYVPTVGTPPFPAILCPLGHARNGKAYPEYQHLFVGLAKRGYVVLAYDAPGQGERIQFWNYLSNERRYQFRSNDHGLYGVQEYLFGQNLARYLIWDGIRALDYLSSLPEVDSSRLGVTGNSGGGALTTYISMLDPRVKVAAPVTFICSIPKKIEARREDAESDPEQDIQGLLESGIGHAGEVAMIAPRPVLIGAATQDFFPIAGTHATFCELQQLYAKLGAPDHIQLAEFNHQHMYSQPLREAAYAWFDRWLKGTRVESVHEPPVEVEVDETLQCTSTGQVTTSLGGKTIFAFNQDEADRLSRRLVARRQDPAFRSQVTALIHAQLALPPRDIQKPAQPMGQISVGDLTVEKLLLETEPGIVLPSRVIRSASNAGRLPAVVYIRDRAGDNDAPHVFEELAQAGRLVAVIDVRGFGETMSHLRVPDTRIGYFHPRDATEANFTYASFFLGRPLLGMRVGDALSAISYIRSRPDVDPRHIAIVGRGWAGLIAAYAGALDRDATCVAVESVPASYEQIARSEEYTQPVSLMLPGVLKDFDLPDVYAAIVPRPLLILNPTDATTRRLTYDQAVDALKLVSSAYRAKQSSSTFEMGSTPYETDVAKNIVAWIIRH